MMGKVLRVFIIIHLVLMIPVIWFGTILFKQRETLKARTHTLEVKLQALGPTIETGLREPGEPPDLPERDEDAIVPRPLDDPERSDIWASYPFSLESSDNPLLTVADLQERLANYYALDSEGRRIPGPMGEPMTTGPGTMQEALDEIVELAEAQLQRLEKTRKQLAGTRAEYIRTVENDNSQRSSLRTAKVTIVNRDASIQRLNSQIGGLRRDVRERDDSIRSLNSNVKERKSQIEELDERISRQKNKLVRLRELYDRLTGRRDTTKGLTRAYRGVRPGLKGSVKSVDEKWHFVLLDLSDEFMDELADEARMGKSPEGIELLVQRPNPDGTLRFITKVKIEHVRGETKVGVANILLGWMQEPVLLGDQIYFN